MKFSKPERIWEVSVNGYEGWLIQNHLSNGLAFGGFRFGPRVTSEEVADLAQAMTWKLGAHGWPVGGAKAGLRCDPLDPDLPKILKDVARAWKSPLTNSVLVGKDMGATDFLLDALYEHLGIPQLHLGQQKKSKCPGKIRELTGYVKHMTGKGAIWAASEALGSLSEKKIAIQGAGAVGAGIVFRASEVKGCIVGISDVDSAVFNSKGIPPEKILDAVKTDFRGIDRSKINFECDIIERDSLLSKDVDVLFLAANSGLVDGKLAQLIKAPVVVEVSNFGITPAGRDVLQKKGIVVIPDVIASSSSAALVAHQLSTGDSISEQDVWQSISTSIRRSTRDGIKKSNEMKVDVRTAYLSELS